MVKLTYQCRNCGEKSVLDSSVMSRLDAIVCPHCGRTFGETAPQQSATLHASAETFDPTLNPEQRQAATYDGPADGIMLLAGAGCGKTRTMIARALFLMKVKGVPPIFFDQRSECHGYPSSMLDFSKRIAQSLEEINEIFTNNHLFSLR